MFTFAQLLTECPAGSIVDDPTHGVIIKVGTMIDEVVDDMSSTKIVEFVGKLIGNCRKAQLTYNAGGGTPLAAALQITSFPAPTNSGVQTTTAGDEIVVRTQTVTSRIALDNTEVLPNLGTL